MPLAMVESGRCVRILAIRSGRGLKGRLAAMGLVPGVDLVVVRNSLNGPLIVSVKESRLVLGRGMVHKILVE